MSNNLQIQLVIGNAIPHGNTADSGDIISLWQQLKEFCREREFVTQCLGKPSIRKYTVALNAEQLLVVLQHASSTSGSFDEYLLAHVQDEAISIAAVLQIEVSVADGVLAEPEAYEVVTLFLQQMILAANLILPGSFQMLNTSYKGKGAYLYETQNFDSKLFFGAGKNLKDSGWWQRQAPTLETTWNWLEQVGVSQAHTAIKNINKTLFSMLKVAEQRNENSARAVLLVVYQIELLLDCRNRNDFNRLRKRARMILGDIPESADCINALYEVRDGMFLGSQPVNRPALISKFATVGFSEVMGFHDSAVELGVALVLVLLRELISKRAEAFVFTERVTCR